MATLLVAGLPAADWYFDRQDQKRANIERAAEHGWIDLDTVVLETLTGIVRAGADIVLTYWAVDVARRLA